MSPLTRRQFSHWTALAAGVVSLGGCAPWEWADPDHELRLALDGPRASPLEWRILNRLGFGPRPGDAARLQSTGVDAWLEQQLHPQAIVESPELVAALARLDTLGMTAEEARECETEWAVDDVIAPLMQKAVKIGKRHRLPPGRARQELAQATVLRATFSNCSLQEVMVEFWSDHFNIDHTKEDCRWLKTVDDRSLRRHALGRFRDLLGASAHSPAMLFYLDNASNRKPGPAAVSRLNENYARELLELHTLGDTRAYTLHDIQEAARALTGWGIGQSETGSAGEFVFHDEYHDNGEKVILGHRLTAGQGQQDGEALLDLLASHPLTAKFIAGKLCQRFIGAVPPDVRDRVAQTFERSNGDIRQVLSTLFASDEFRQGDWQVLKRPFHFAVSALRMLGARTSGIGIVRHLEAMGQRPFNWAQPDGYPLQAEPWTGGLLARWNFAIDLALNRVDETWINLSGLELANRGRTGRDTCRQLSECLLPAPLPADQFDMLAGLGSGGDALPQWLAALLISPQFQWC